MDLTVQDAVQRAMDKNIDIGVARITPRLTDFTIAGLQANYRVNLTAATSNNRQTNLPRLTTQGSPSRPRSSSRTGRRAFSRTSSGAAATTHSTGPTRGSTIPRG